MVQKNKNNKSKPVRIRYNNNLKLDLDNSLDTLIKNGNVKLIANTHLVELTKNNSAIIEQMIKDDYGCIPFAEMIYKQIYSENKRSFPDNERAWVSLVRIIDSDNNTQVWRYHRDVFYEIIKFICDKKNDFIKNLSNKNIGIVDNLVGCLSARIQSLPSKICKYVSEYMGFGDNYFVDDYYIRSMLPFYLNYYKVNYTNICTKKQLASRTWREKSMRYEDLFNLMNSLLDCINANKTKQQKLTKNELDHIIWYCYKGYSRD